MPNAKTPAAQALADAVVKEWSLLQVAFQQVKGSLYQEALERLRAAKERYEQER
jgi:hypothetical protein